MKNCRVQRITALNFSGEEEILAKITNIKEQDEVVYKACGALVPSMVNFLALPDFLEKTLQTATGMPDICSDKCLAGGTLLQPVRVAKFVLTPCIKANIAAAKIIVNAGNKVWKTVQSSNKKSETSLSILGKTQEIIACINKTPRDRCEEEKTYYDYAIEKDPVTKLSLSVLGSTVNRELQFGLRIHLVKTWKTGQSIEKITAPAILLSSGRIVGVVILKRIKLFYGNVLVNVSEMREKTASAFESIKSQSEQIIKESKSLSILLPWHHPLVSFLDEKLQHECSSGLDYTEHKMLQESTLQKQHERKLKRARKIEYARLRAIARENGYRSKYFNQFEKIPIITKRAEALKLEINSVNDFDIKTRLPADIENVRAWIRQELREQFDEISFYMNQAKRKFETLNLSSLGKAERLEAVNKAIAEVDVRSLFFSNLLLDKWPVDHWYSSPVARTHYLALLEPEKQALEKEIAEIKQPLEDFKGKKYEQVYTYVENHPKKATLFLVEVQKLKNTYWFSSSYPNDLIDFESSLIRLIQSHAKNQPGEALFFLEEIKVYQITFFWTRRGYPEGLIELENELLTLIQNYVKDHHEEVSSYLKRIKLLIERSAYGSGDFALIPLNLSNLEKSLSELERTLSLQVQPMPVEGLAKQADTREQAQKEAEERALSEKLAAEKARLEQEKKEVAEAARVEREQAEQAQREQEAREKAQKEAEKRDRQLLEEQQAREQKAAAEHKFAEEEAATVKALEIINTQNRLVDLEARLEELRIIYDTLPMLSQDKVVQATVEQAVQGTLVPGVLERLPVEVRSETIEAVAKQAVTTGLTGRLLVQFSPEGQTQVQAKVVATLQEHYTTVSPETIRQELGLQTPQIKSEVVRKYRQR